MAVGALTMSLRNRQLLLWTHVCFSSFSLSVSYAVSEGVICHWTATQPVTVYAGANASRPRLNLRPPCWDRSVGLCVV